MSAERESLCRRLTRETLLLLLAFLLILSSLGGALIVWPLLSTATTDLARVMQITADRRAAQPGVMPAPVWDEVAALWLQTQTPDGLRPSYLPFAHVLGRALTRRAGREVSVQVDPQGRYWAPLQAGGNAVWVGFDTQRVGTRPPLMLLLLALVLVGLALGFSVLVASRMTRPLAQLIAASARLGRGDTDVRVAETGPREIAALAQAFNTLAGRLRELLDNRATLLVGLSHDLRTPLARLRLSLEMLEGTHDAELVAGMERDLEALKALLDDVLALERGLHLERGRQARVDAVLADVVAAARRAGHRIEWSGQSCARAVSEIALKRVLDNLIENAARYGGTAPITVTAVGSADGAILEIADRGPGIPAAQRSAVLRPFYRLDASRSSGTGGHGLGLAIVQQICRAQEWGIELADRDGGGLRVVLRLGCVQRAAAVVQRGDPTHTLV